MNSLITKCCALPNEIINQIKSYVIFTPKNRKELKDDPYAWYDDELQDAVDLWCDDKKLAYKLYGHISLWDTKYITDMRGLFCNKKHFNGVISSWDVSNVTNMDGMFVNAKLFNQPLNNWDVSKVENTMAMFEGAHSFDKTLENWDVRILKICMLCFFGRRHLINH